MSIEVYLKEQNQNILDKLFGLLRIPSISAKPEHKNDMQKAAEYWKNILIEAGADKAEIYQTNGNPIVYAEKIIHHSLPTVLVYAHYDVMPAEPFELWETQPFEPTIKHDKIYARGADDDKGQGFMHAVAFEYLVKTNQLKCNVKFMIEGEEEIGSPSMIKWCYEHKEMLKADVILVSDTGMIAADTPSITAGLRGLTYLQIEVTGPNRDLHSGLFGGAVANPLNVLCKIIASMQDDNGKITIPGFYNDVLEYTDEQRKLINQIPFNEENYKKSLGIKELWGEKGYTTIERTGIRPTLDLCGIWGGYTGEGSKTVLPSKAYAKLSSRIVPYQQHEKIGKLIKDYILSIAPPTVSVSVEILHGGQPYVTPLDLPALDAARKALFDVYGKEPLPTMSGGSIPIIATFEEILGLKSVLMGFGLESDAIHSPNENYPLQNFYNGIKSIVKFYEYFSKTT
ncbi:MAG: dipeptidase [Bacteroidales bacterium]|nr:dipeptidase [Bacteroidales bacterium]